MSTCPVVPGRPFGLSADEKLTLPAESIAATGVAPELTTDTWLEPSDVVSLRSISPACKTGHQQSTMAARPLNRMDFNIGIEEPSAPLRIGPNPAGDNQKKRA